MGTLLHSILLLILRRNQARLYGMVSGESMMKENLCVQKDFLDMAVTFWIWLKPNVHLT